VSAVPILSIKWMSVLAFGVGAILVCWLLLSGFGFGERLAPPVLALVEHLRAHGIATTATPVRRESSDIKSKVMLLIPGHDPISVLLCTSADAAGRQFGALQANPDPMHPRRFGELVVYLAFWKDDDPLLRKTLSALDSFHNEPAATPGGQSPGDGGRPDRS